MEAQEKAEKEEQREAVDNAGVEDKDIQFLAEIILFRAKKDVSRF